MNWLENAIPDWLKAINRKLLGKWDQRLLLNKPDVWRIKPHLFIVYSGIIANLLLAIIAVFFSAPVESGFGMGLSMGDIMIAFIILLVILIWGQYMLRSPISTTGISGSVKIVLLTTFCLLLLAVNATIIPSWNNVKYGILLPNEQFETDYKTLNAYGFFRQQWYHHYMFSDRYEEFTRSDYFTDIFNGLESRNLFIVESRADEMIANIEHQFEPENSADKREWETMALINDYLQEMAGMASKGSGFFSRIFSNLTVLMTPNIEWETLATLNLEVSKILGKPYLSSSPASTYSEMSFKERLDAFNNLRQYEFKGKEPEFFHSNRFNTDSISRLDFSFRYLDGLSDFDLNQLAFHVYLKHMEQVHAENVVTGTFGDTLALLDPFIESKRLEKIVGHYLPEVKNKVPPEIIYRDGAYAGIKEFRYAQDLSTAMKRIKDARYQASRNEGLTYFKMFFYMLFVTLFLPGLLIMLSFNNISQLIFQLMVGVGIAGMLITMSVFLGGVQIATGDPENYFKLIGIFSLVYGLMWFLFRSNLRKGSKTGLNSYLSGSIIIGIPVIGLLFMLIPSGDTEMVFFSGMTITFSFLVVTIVFNLLIGIFALDYIRYQNLPEQ